MTDAIRKSTSDKHAHVDELAKSTVSSAVNDAVVAGVIQHGDDFVLAVERDPGADDAANSAESDGEPATG